MTKKELRCDCGTLVAVLENGCLVIEAKHHGEKHVTSFSLATLWRMAHSGGPGRLTISAEPHSDGRAGDKVLR